MQQNLTRVVEVLYYFVHTHMHIDTHIAVSNVHIHTQLYRYMMYKSVCNARMHYKSIIPVQISTGGILYFHEGGRYK